jgi:hypothetical protein
MRALAAATITLALLGCDSANPCMELQSRLKSCWMAVDCQLHQENIRCATQRMLILAFDTDCDDLTAADIEPCKQMQLAGRDFFARTAVDLEQCDVSAANADKMDSCEPDPNEFCDLSQCGVVVARPVQAPVRN